VLNNRGPVPGCAILIPVLARPHRVEPLLSDIKAATPQNHRILFIADVDDNEEITALEQAGADYITVDQPRNYAAKINAGYHATNETLVFSGADDLHFHSNWLPRASMRITSQIHVVGTNDLGNESVMRGEHSTHTLFTRHYIETESGVVDAANTVLHEGYPHDYCDNEFIETAKSRGRYVMAFDSVVEHMHWVWGKGTIDDVYRKAMSMSSVGRALFERRRRLWIS
jgi:glycosyltransferase involved in cell wall biosynthesis